LHLHMQGAIKGDELLESHNGTEENAYKWELLPLSTWHAIEFF
jgi:hypothetical protein